MIKINDKEACCGCGACVQICSKQCITMQSDEEGFYYPSVNIDKCVDCGLCNNVCPMLNQNQAHSPIISLAYKTPNEINRLKSSSGGLFIELANCVIAQHGVVFGVTYDADWMPVHSYADDKEGIRAFMGSKYVQSRIGNSYADAKRFLREGRIVLFSGTPCQIAGLKTFLRKGYDNLITIEIMCHGVPSPGVWKDYIKKICPNGIDGQNTVLSSLNDMPLIDGISFRDKTNGWSKYGFVVYGKSASKADQNSVLSSKHIIIKQWSKENPYMQAFLSNVILRPACYNCQYKSGKSGADFSIGDFWTIDSYKPEMNDDKGVTLAYVLSQKGKEFLRKTGICYEELPLGVEYNSAFKISASQKYPREKFWKQYKEQGLSCIGPIFQSTKPGFWKRMYIRITNRLPFLKHK